MSENSPDAAVQAIEDAIERAGSPTQLAAAVECTERQVYRWRSGEAVPSAESAKAIGEATGVALCRLRPDLWEG